MDKIIIADVDFNYDGEWEIDVSYFTNRELHLIKRLTGVRAAELEAAFAAGDNDLVVAMAAIALQRNGKPLHEDVLWDARAGTITFVGGDDADPPAEAPPSETGSADGASEN